MHPIHWFDSHYTSRIRGLPQSWRPWMRAISVAGEPFIVFLVGLAGFVLAADRGHPAIERAFIYAGVAYGVNILLKLLLHRKRPHGRIIRTLGIQSYSFPSGHAFGSVILYGLLAYLAFRHLNGPAEVLLAVLLLGLILMTGISRVYLGSHYPSDVLAGWLLGALSLAIIIPLA